MLLKIGFEIYLGIGFSRDLIYRDLVGEKCDWQRRIGFRAHSSDIYWFCNLGWSTTDPSWSWMSNMGDNTFLCQHCCEDENSLQELEETIYHKMLNKGKHFACSFFWFMHGKQIKWVSRKNFLLEMYILILGWWLTSLFSKTSQRDLQSC